MSNRPDDKFIIPKQVLMDSISRFLMEEDNRAFEDRIHFCTYMELAYWFYCDCWVDESPDELKLVSFTCFVTQVLKGAWLYGAMLWDGEHSHSPELLSFREALEQDHGNDLAQGNMYAQGLPCPGGGTAAQLCAEFVDFKHRVNTYGGILVNQDLNKVLLVQSFNGQSWGFPKGKIEENEAKVVCAIREVKEEIDYDMSPYINPNIFIETTILEQVARLYIIFGVSEETPFKTNTRKEIGDIRWFNLSILPLHKRDKKPLKNTTYTPNNFFVVIPFVKQLREQVATMQQQCMELFGAPYYKQEDEQHHAAYLERFYPDIYQIRLQGQQQVNKQQKQLQKQQQRRSTEGRGPQSGTPNILQMLKEAKQRGKMDYKATTLPGDNSLQSRSIYPEYGSDPASSSGIETMSSRGSTSSTGGAVADPKHAGNTRGGGNGAANISGDCINNSSASARQRRASSSEGEAAQAGSRNRVQRSSSARNRNRRSKRHASGGGNQSAVYGDNQQYGQQQYQQQQQQQFQQLQHPQQQQSHHGQFPNNKAPPLPSSSSSSSSAVAAAAAPVIAARRPPGIHPVQAWTNASLDIDDIMEALERTWRLS